MEVVEGHYLEEVGGKIQLETLNKVSEVSHTYFIPSLSYISHAESLGGGGQNSKIFGSG